MKFFKILLLIVFLFPLNSHANSNFLISNWSEQIELTKTGKASEIFIQAQVKELPANQAMTSFAISFDKRRDIKITSVICDKIPANYSFSNNSLRINFPRSKPNNSSATLYFSYEERYKNIHQFLREELIDIPSFARGAKAEIVFNFPGYLESATLNPNVAKVGNSFVYSNIVPESGVRESIKLTPTQSFWEVEVVAKLRSVNSLKNTTVTIPNYFRSGQQQVQNLVIKPSVNSFKQSTLDNKNIFKFNGDEKEITVITSAQISAGRNNRNQILRNPADFLDVSEEDRALLSPVLEQIKQTKKYRNLPFHAQIGKFVNQFIRYDSSYVSKLPKIKEVLENPVGVCTEYARLYNALARMNKIPSVVVNGAACGEYDKCRGHAWNMIYLDNQWIEVDPTWDLMSGIVSSSHVYFNDYEKDGIEVQYFDESKNVELSMDFEMKNLR